jgi:hypothetical protein
MVLVACPVSRQYGGALYISSTSRSGTTYQLSFISCTFAYNRAVSPPPPRFSNDVPTETHPQPPPPFRTAHAAPDLGCKFPRALDLCRVERTEVLM